MLIAGYLVCTAAGLLLVWYRDFCPGCRSHSLEPADVGPRCQRCGWFER